jgi:hypothetical protein
MDSFTNNPDLVDPEKDQQGFRPHDTFAGLDRDISACYTLEKGIACLISETVL